MKSFLQPGEMLDVAAPYDVLSGKALMIVSLIGVASTDALSGAQVAVATEGVYSLAKKSADTFVVGQKVNWNNSTKEFQTATSTLDGCATVVEAAAPGAVVAKLLLVQV